MKHKGCGGELYYDTKQLPYEYVPELIGSPTEFHFPLMCKKCGEEILGDAMIDLDLEGLIDD